MRTRSLILLFSIVLFQPMDAISQSFPSDWKWKVGISFNRSKTFRNMSSDYLSDSSTLVAYNQLKEREHLTKVNSYGIDIERKLNNTFSLRTGLFFSGYGKEGSFKYVYHFTTNPENIFLPIGKSYKSVYYFLTIPIGTNIYYVNCKKVKLFFKTSVELNYLGWLAGWSHQSQTHGAGIDHKGISRIHKGYSGNKINFSVNISTGIDLRLSSRTFFRFEPSLYFLLRPMKESSINEYYFKYGGTASLNFILKYSENRKNSKKMSK